MQKTLLFVFIIGTLAMMLVMSLTGASLKTQATPKGILDLELPFTKQKATMVLQAWQTSYNDKEVSNTRVAINNTWWDFAFIFFYSGLLYLLVRMIVRRHTGMLNRVGLFFQKAIGVVALLDVAENIGMFRMLAGAVNTPLVLFTSVAAALKWILVLLIIIYILLTGLMLLTKRRSV